MSGLAVPLAALAAFALAGAWYHPRVFGSRWARLTRAYAGLSEAQLAEAIPRKAALWAFGFVVHAAPLQWLLIRGGANTFELAGPIAVAATVPALVLATWPPIHARQPFGIRAMNAGLQLLQALVMAAVLVRFEIPRGA
jgi:hypothetical protein